MKTEDYLSSGETHRRTILVQKLLAKGKSKTAAAVLKQTLGSLSETAPERSVYVKLLRRAYDSAGYATEALPERHTLSKSTFLTGNQCAKALFLSRYKPSVRDPLSAETKKRFNAGHRFGKAAQELFPGGFDVRELTGFQFREAVGLTSFLISGQTESIYEAGFQAEGILIFLDLLCFSKSSGWEAFEVKYSRKISDVFLEDCALQYYVMTKAGMQVQDFSLVIAPKKELEKTADAEEIKVISVLEELKPKVPKVAAQIKKHKETLKGNMPDIAMGEHCTKPYSCRFLTYCRNNRSLFAV